MGQALIRAPSFKGEIPAWIGLPPNPGSLPHFFIEKIGYKTEQGVHYSNYESSSDVQVRLAGASQVRRRAPTQA